MVTILYAHPYEKSFNHAILETIVDKLAATGRDYKVIDLYADGFNPAMEAESLRLFSCDESADPHVPAYLATLMASDEFIMIFPIWWSTMPAIVDGFFDKVMLGGGKAFQYAPDGRLVPAAIHMKRTLMISTSEAPTEVFKDFFAGIRDIVGGRAGSYESVLREAKETALQEMSQQAARMGANAVIAVDLDYETVGGSGSMLMVTAAGTAVRYE